MKYISVVVPAYNEEKNLPVLYQKIRDVFHGQSYEFELIIVDDGSADATWKVISDLALQDSRIKGVRFSRNFGHQIALTAGYDYASGAAVVSMDADLQHPPETLPRLIEAWQNKGVDIVYARRTDRKDSFFKKVTARAYYRLLGWITDVKIPRVVGDFRLIDKKVLTVLRQCREQARYLRGLVAWTGFRHTYIVFDCPDRYQGESGYTWRKMFTLGFDGITAFSLFPLKLAAYIGVLVVITGVLMFGYITIDALIYNVRYPLYKWLVTMVYIFMGVQFLLLWLLGEYIGRMHEQQKKRPLYVVDAKKNLS